MEACLAEELGKQHQELLETTWEQLKGEEFISKFGYPLVELLWLSTRKLQTKRNPGLYLQEVLSFLSFNCKLLG